MIKKLTFLILFNACIGFSTSRALLIGVGEFPYFPSVSPWQLPERGFDIGNFVHAGNLIAHAASAN